MIEELRNLLLNIKNRKIKYNQRQLLIIQKKILKDASNFVSRKKFNLLKKVDEKEVIEIYNESVENLLETFNKKINLSFTLILNYLNRVFLIEKLSFLLSNQKPKINYPFNLPVFINLLIKSLDIELERQLARDINNFRGVDLVRISESNKETCCRACKKWEGKTISLNGEIKIFPSLKQVLEEKPSIFHPNCTHTFISLTKREQVREISKKLLKKE